MRRCCALLFGFALLPAIAIAQLPAPIDPSRYAFPGSVPAPASGTSAALALADRWLGDEPFSNPALPPRSRLSITPVFQRVSRQDLSSSNREFSDQGGSIDLAGAYASWKIHAVALAAYFGQPGLRIEDNAYTLGLGLVPGPSAIVTTSSTAREMRTGLGVSFPLGPGQIGLAGEWTQLQHRYEYHEESGSPAAGDQSVEFSGGAFGAVVGARAAWTLGARALELGAAVRRLPETPVD
ncbi:MAG: hypothetical protein HYR73_00995, partial [Candidatus Eisenbacteria bacterium]|nr:hypothetical protein [Candidatus Eisenbacteria bacterium]